jgi:PIN domain
MEATWKRWAFVDYENQPKSLQFISQHHEYNCVLVFFGSQQKVAAEFNNSLIIRLIRMENIGKNNLDFHLSYYLGKYDAKLDKRIAFDIFTQDTGFDHLIKFIQQRGRNCQRIGLNQDKVATIQKISQLETAKIVPLKVVAPPPAVVPAKFVEPVVQPPTLIIQNPHLMPAVQRVIDNLQKVAHRPKTVEKLSNTINSLIRSFNDDTLSAQLILEALQQQRKISLNPATKSIQWHF